MTTIVSRIKFLPVLICLTLTACGGEEGADFMRSGEQYMARQDYDAATIQFRNAVQVNPTDHAARMQLARASLNSGDISSADKEARKALELGGARDDLVPLLARIQLAKGDPEGVLTVARENPLSDAAAKIDLGMLVGVAYLELGKLDQADAAFQDVLEAAPANLDARVGRAKVKFVRGDSAGANKLLDEVLAGDAKLHSALSLSAELAYAQGDKDRAIEIYQRLITGNSRDLDARFRLGLIRIEREELQEAQRLIDEIGNAAPRDARGPYLSAVLAWRRGDAKLAAERTAQVLRVQPDHAPSIMLNGLASLATGQLETAKSRLETVRKHPLYVLDASRALAQTHLSAGDPDRAIEVAEQALAQAPNDPALQAVLGEAAIAKGDVAGATRILGGSAPADRAGASTAAIRLGQALLASGDAAKGLGMLETAARMHDRDGRAALTLALQHLRARNFSEALEWVARLERETPDSPNPPALRGMVYAAQGKYDDARKSYEAALQREPGNALAIDALGRLDVVQGRPAQARARYEAALAKWPADESIAISYVAWLRAQGAPPDEVLSRINGLLTANPNAGNAQLARVDLLLAYGRGREAVQAAQELSSKRPDSRPALMALAKAQVADGQLERAVATYRRLADLEPGSEVAWMRVADVAAMAGQHGAAVSAAKRMLDIRPDSAEARQRLIRSHALQGQYDAALKIARELQSSRPREAQGYILEADVEASRKRFDHAVEALRKALEQVPDSSSAASKLHDVLNSAGQAAEADRGIRAWLAAHPKDTHARSYLAQRLALEGKYAASRALFEEVVQVAPNDADAHNNLAWVGGKLKDARALEHARRAVALAPDKAAYLDTLGALLLDAGDGKAAVEVLQRAVELQPGLAIARLTLAKALIETGNAVGARRHLQALLAGAAPEVERKEAQGLMDRL